MRVFWFFLHLLLILTLLCCTFNWSSSVKYLFINQKKLLCNLFLKCFEHFICSLLSSLQLQKRINQFQVEDINYFACLTCADSICVHKCRIQLISIIYWVLSSSLCYYYSHMIAYPSILIIQSSHILFHLLF